MGVYVVVETQLNCPSFLSLPTGWMNIPSYCKNHSLAVTVGIDASIVFQLRSSKI